MNKNENREQELLAQIEQLQQKVVTLQKRKKYGLVWEDKPEEFDKVSKDAFPILKNKGGKYKDILDKNNQDDDYNILIEGDNYHALSVLNYTHRGAIDVIYIDPPYNTGKKDFIYNDKFIDNDDVFKHSKWLSFINKRLLLARKLLKDSGVIFISIDDNEQARLKVLCDEVLGEDNFVSTVAVENNPKGRKNSKFISKSNDFLLVYVKNKHKSYFKENILKDTTFLIDEQDRKYTHGKRVLVGESSNDFVTDYASEKNYIAYYRQSTKELILKKVSEIKLDNQLLTDGFMAYVSKRGIQLIENTYSAQKITELFKDEALIFKKDSVYEKDFNLNTRMKSILKNTKKIDLKTETAGRDLKNMGIIFSNPKNRNFLQLLFTLLPRKDSIILDFFSGSGTTGHAVLELNKEDGGNRKFILSTNNENNICEEVTYERIKRVMKGYTTPKGDKIEGLGGKLKYLKTDFLPKQVPGKVTDEDKLKLSYEAGLILALKENTFDKETETDFYQIYKNSSKVTAIYFRENKEKLNELLELLDQTGKPVKLYIFSWEKGAYKGEFSEYKNITTEDIPEPLLEVYKSIGL